MKLQRKSTVALVSLAVAGVFGATTYAVAGPGRGEMRGALAAADADGNQAISTAEAEAFFSERARAADANKDGAVTTAEIDAWRRAEREKRRAERFAALDTNADGKVSVDEFAQGHAAMLMKRDANGDGELARGEGRRGGRHGHRRGGGE